VVVSAKDRLATRNDLAWAISVGGIGVVGFAGLLVLTWYFAATLFLIFAGMLLGVALNAMTNMLGRVVRLPHSLRLTIVCLQLFRARQFRRIDGFVDNGNARRADT
jgi:predicted PurR-regulated permease PerM